jgi:orotidine-5'-phosphate decarboxylase
LNFTDNIKNIQRSKNSLLCIGLDTDVKKIPRFLLSKRNAVLEFNKRIIDATKDIVCAYKINFAFYEAMGKTGWTVIEKTLTLIPSSVLTIADAKRGDIGNSSLYYAKGILNDLNFNAVTVSPYLGRDSVMPFLQWEEKGVFLLALTSNEGASDFQYSKIRTRRLFEEVIVKARTWTKKKNLGFVTGATKSRDIQIARKLAPNAPLLIPGVGAQGGDLESVVRYGCSAKGDLAVVNASRSIIYASGRNNFEDAAREQALKLRNEMNHYRGKYFFGGKETHTRRSPSPFVG